MKNMGSKLASLEFLKAEPEIHARAMRRSIILSCITTLHIASQTKPINHRMANQVSKSVSACSVLSIF